MDLNTPNLTGLLQSRQCPPDMANGCFDAFGYISLGSEVMHLKIAQHPFTQRASGELIHSRASRGTFAAWWMFRIGNGPKKDAVEGVNVISHGLRKSYGAVHDFTLIPSSLITVQADILGEVL